jgi:hypothetical protein
MRPAINVTYADGPIGQPQLATNCLYSTQDEAIWGIRGSNENIAMFCRPQFDIQH